MEDLQERILEFCKTHDLSTPAEFRLLDLLSELGEVSKEMLKETDYGS